MDMPGQWPVIRDMSGITGRYPASTVSIPYLNPVFPQPDRTGPHRNLTVSPPLPPNVRPKSNHPTVSRHLPTTTTDPGARFGHHLLPGTLPETRLTAVQTAERWLRTVRIVTTRRT